MSKRNRVFGDNVKFFIVNGKFNEQTVAEHLGFSKYDLWKIMDGRLFLDEDEKADIARELHTTVEKLYIPRKEEYHKLECMECRETFSFSKNKVCILDLLDIYCDVQELIMMR